MQPLRELCASSGARTLREASLGPREVTNKRIFVRVR